MIDLERIPAEEAAQIDNIVNLTIAHLKRRYPSGDGIRRAVHAKDHGCVRAQFEVLPELPDDLRVGVFSRPGHVYDAWIRFSNAAVLDAADSQDESGVIRHGSRGMAIQLQGVSGTPLIPTVGALTQDFLMVNHPVFAFANVEDYEALNLVLQADGDAPNRFFKERIRRLPEGKPDLADPVTRRAVHSAQIVSRIQSDSLTPPPRNPPTPPAFQEPPASPVDNRYFSAAPFMFGSDRVMKFSATPVAPQRHAVPNLTQRDYLKEALYERLKADDAKAIVFTFQVQLRPASDFVGKVESEIEDACFEWAESVYRFRDVARITIPPQDIKDPDRQKLCENLSFTPWSGVAEHRPLGGINRLRRAVYEASAQFRHASNDPALF